MSPVILMAPPKPTCRWRSKVLFENFRTLDPYQQAFIEEASTQPYSFFVIIDVTEGEKLGISDIFLDRAFTVKESATSKVLGPGDVIFSRVVELEGQAIMLGLARRCCPLAVIAKSSTRGMPSKRASGQMGSSLNPKMLLASDLEMRSLYFEFVESLSNPPMPRVRNTDGEPVKFTKLFFSLEYSPQEALAGLKSLSRPEFQDGIVHNSILDAEGDLLEVTFGWQKRGNKKRKHWENTILGTLTIKGNTLTAEVNSEKRAERTRYEIEKRLKRNATFLAAEFEDLESKLEEMKNQADNPASEEVRREMEEFQSRPEIQKIVRKTDRGPLGSLV